MKNEVGNLCPKSKTGFRMDFVEGTVCLYLWHVEITGYVFYYRVCFSLWFQWYEHKVRKVIGSPGLIPKRGKKPCLNKLMLFYSKSLLKMKTLMTLYFWLSIEPSTCSCNLTGPFCGSLEMWISIIDSSNNLLPPNYQCPVCDDHVMFSGCQSPGLCLAVSTSSPVGGCPETLLCEYLWCPVPVLLWIFRKQSSVGDHSSNWQVRVISWSQMGKSELEKSPRVGKGVWDGTEGSRMEGMKAVCNELMKRHSRCWLQLGISSREPS